ncbi:MAG TPA: hypothetical protein VNM22_22660 [Candidatus Limnocylindrales bacterium]|nr:hypothetical protein [Candidatus Limnocylindrales bacterium]
MEGWRVWKGGRVEVWECGRKNILPTPIPPYLHTPVPPHSHTPILTLRMEEAQKSRKYEINKISTALLGNLDLKQYPSDIQTRIKTYTKQLAETVVDGTALFPEVARKLREFIQEISP